MATQKWDFDLAHSAVGFWVRHLMISKVHGRFGKWSGVLELDEQRPADAKLEVRIDAASIDTKEPQRDAHLRSADFFEVEKYPELVFRSTSVSDGGDGRYRVMGDLTIRGVTRPVTLDVEYSGTVKDPWGGERAGFSARASVNRKDFGLVWNQVLETGGIAVGDKVEIQIEIEAVKAQAAKAA